jgi:hypothetical protein
MFENRFDWLLFQVLCSDVLARRDHSDRLVDLIIIREQFGLKNGSVQVHDFGRCKKIYQVTGSQRNRSQSGRRPVAGRERQVAGGSGVI